MLRVSRIKTPNRSTSYTGVRQANTSISHPLQLEPSSMQATRVILILSCYILPFLLRLLHQHDYHQVNTAGCQRHDQVHFGMVCHLTLGNTLSISVSRRNEARHTRMAAGMLNQLELTMKSPMTPSRNTFSYQWEELPAPGYCRKAP